MNEFGGNFHWYLRKEEEPESLRHDFLSNQKRLVFKALAAIVVWCQISLQWFYCFTISVLLICVM